MTCRYWAWNPRLSLPTPCATAEAFLVLATPMTLRLEKFQQLYARYGEGAIPLPCPGLMELVEQEANEQARRYLLELLHPYDLRTVDAVVLGCTHYVFLRPLLREILPENVQVLDGNEGTARQLRRVLTENDLLCARETPGKSPWKPAAAPETVLPVMRRLLVRADTMYSIIWLQTVCRTFSIFDPSAY